MVSKDIKRVQATALLVVAMAANNSVARSEPNLQVAKCSFSLRGCYDQARSICGGRSFQILRSENHAGGLIADVMPGPVPWYTITYSCRSPVKRVLSANSNASPSKLVSFCLSDGELKQILTEGTLHELGSLSGLCLGRFPELQSRGLEVVKKFQAVFSDELQSTDRESKRILSRHGLTEEQQDRFYKVEVQKDLEEAKTFSSYKCSKVINNLELWANLKNFSMVQIAALEPYSEQRRRIPTCSTGEGNAQQTTNSMTQANLVTSPAERTVSLKLSGDLLMVPVEINDSIKLDFAIDSGASDISVPADVFSTLRRSGTVQDADLIGTGTYLLANGTRFNSVRFKIKSLTLGGVTLTNVVGSVSPATGQLLLGQSVLSRFKSWSIDNKDRKLHLLPR